MIEEASTVDTPKARWLCLSAVLLLCITTFFNMFKAPPLFGAFTDPSRPDHASFGFTSQNVGLLISALGIADIFFAVPAALLLNKLGPRRTLFVTGAAVIVGSLGGAVAENFHWLFATRLIEGMGVSLVSVSAPALTFAIAPKRQRGLAMGLFGAMAPLGTVIAMIVAPRLYDSFGSWRLVWIVGAIVAAAAVVYTFIVFHPLESPMSTGLSTHDAPHTPSVPIRRKTVLTVVALAVVFFCWNVFWTGSYNGFFSQFLFSTHLRTLSFAGMMVSISSAVSILASPVCGTFIDHRGHRKTVLVLALLLTAMLNIFAWIGDGSVVWIAIVGFGLCAGAVPLVVLRMGQDAAWSQHSVAIVIAFLSISMDLGMVVGSAVFPLIRAHLDGSWVGTVWTLVIPALLLGMLSVLLIPGRASVVLPHDGCANEVIHSGESDV